MLEPPLYPERSLWKRGDRPETLHVLNEWVSGRPFHQYGIASWNRGDDYERLNPPLLEYRGERSNGIGGGYVSWSIMCRQQGIHGLHSCSGYSEPQHAAYVLLSGIEQAERDAYELDLVEGVA